MKALQITSYGDQEVATVVENIRTPVPSDNQLLIRVHAAGVNPVDWKVREGLMQQYVSINFPFILGMDFSGVVVKVGKNVIDFKVGDAVYGMSNVFNGGTGAFAEYLVVDKNNIAHKPKTVSHEIAAALPMTGVTALQMMTKYLSDKKNNKVFIHGGAGGVGSMAIQIAKHLGATVVTTAAQSNTAYVKTLGADEIIDYQNQAFENIVKEVDVVLDTIGGETYQKSFQVLKKGGIIVSLLESPDENRIKKYDVKAVMEFTEMTSQKLAQLVELVDKKIVTLQLDKVFKFSDVKAALDYQQNGRPRGKVVVNIKEQKQWQ